MFLRPVRRFLSTIYHNTWCVSLYHLKLFFYWTHVSKKVDKFRQKDIVKVLFVVSEAASWKTEVLYVSMLNHKRFYPIIGVSTSRAPSGAKKTLVDYLKSKKYNFVDLDKNVHSIEEIDPDIIFYYKPYGMCYSEGYFYSNYLKYLFCGIDYCFETEKNAAHIDKDYFDYCWQFYVENNEIAQCRKDILGYRSRNTIITGVPMQDILLSHKTNFLDPWKDKTGKKRIIYAPHHSFKGTNGAGIEYATFLEYGKIMLELAKKYREKVTFAFKPHPNLYMKLLNIWGKEKTDDYYNEWRSLDNTQLEMGEYVGLFKYSDAIIHDCASFIVEYLYMDKPGMYLVAETNNMDNMFKYVRVGFNCYEHGYAVYDIENFIYNVIKGYDLKQNKRKKYIHDYLLPPNGKTACENIINAILGV